MRIVGKQAVAWVLLISLGLQPGVVLAHDWTQELKANQVDPEEKLAERAAVGLSSFFQSPTKKELAAYSFLASHPLGLSNHLSRVIHNDIKATEDNQASLFDSAELKPKQAWVRLCETLQFSNIPGKKSIFGNISRTMTHAGKVAFFNLIGQQNQDWQVTQRRQALIKRLVDKPELLRSVRNSLKVIKDYEEAFAKELCKPVVVEDTTSLKKVVGAVVFIFANLIAFYGEKAVCWALFKQTSWAGWRAASFVSVLLGFCYLCDKLVNESEFLSSSAQNVANVQLALAALGVGAMGAGIALDPSKTLTACFNGGRRFLKSSFVQRNIRPAFTRWNNQLQTDLASADAFLGTRYTQPMREQDIAAWGQQAPLVREQGYSMALGGASIFCRGMDRFLEEANQSTFSPEPALSNWFSQGSTRKLSQGLGITVGVVGAGLGMMLMSRFTHNKARYIKAKTIAQVVRNAGRIRNALAQEKDLNDGYGDFFEGLPLSYRQLIARSFSPVFDENKHYGAQQLFIGNQALIEHVVKAGEGAFQEASQLMQFYGELDVYASLAQLIVDHQMLKNNQGEDIACCFATLVLDKPESMVVAKGMWHPLFPVETVRTNSVCLGDSPEHPRNGIITGPNAAGKSAAMKALLVNLVLSQTFGIACAQEFTFTPFAKIIGQLGSSDDTANDQSKFMVEATLVVELLKALRALGENEKAFVCTDELFSGTEVEPAILLSVELCARVSSMPRVCYILATHYKDLTRLKDLTGNKFENYKVTAFINEEDKIIYPFKLSPGIGDTNIAFDIFLDQMHKQGVNDPELESIVQGARARQHIVG